VVIGVDAVPGFVHDAVGERRVAARHLQQLDVGLPLRVVGVDPGDFAQRTIHAVAFQNAFEMTLEPRTGVQDDRCQDIRHPLARCGVVGHGLAVALVSALHRAIVPGVNFDVMVLPAAAPLLRFERSARFELHDVVLVVVHLVAALGFHLEGAAVAADPHLQLAVVVVHHDGRRPADVERVALGWTGGERRGKQNAARSRTESNLAGCHAALLRARGDRSRLAAPWEPTAKSTARVQAGFAAIWRSRVPRPRPGGRVAGAASQPPSEPLAGAASRRPSEPTWPTLPPRTRRSRLANVLQAVTLLVVPTCAWTSRGDPAAIPPADLDAYQLRDR